MNNLLTMKLILCKPGKLSRKEREEDNLCTSPNVEQEYHETFRTKSYIEICNKVQGQLGKTSTTRFSSSPSTSTSLPFRMHLTEYLLEPRQGIITNMTHRFKVHNLLVGYFNATLEASLCCDNILERIDSMRHAKRRITRVVMLSKRVLDFTNENDQTLKDIYKELASFSLQNNPLSIISTIQFHDIHDRYIQLLHSLKSKRRRIQRIVSLKKVCKTLGGIALVTSHCAIIIALLVFSFHSIVGLVAAPTIVGGLVDLFMKRIKRVHERFRISYSERLYNQLDVAAKGVYILVNDLDTMSRMVKRLHDEVEHWKMIADVCVKNMKGEILKQVLGDFNEHESSFLEQLEELEEHVYLCFLTINRSRRQVMQEIMDKER
ncbi:hypothetical protein Lal_00019563 [Lupinus albus]|uniref:Uncharacterized protein n=1 Tax=Lupinus albus TaxID=3870 RepID=A0A6A5PN48_LUPAL|nr:hypothetical protein Lalb_Chr01g0008531 [Lupinus albus]KAF1899435.1 hypothetical protein Lal_00019563 [Lupinus albus]